VVRCEKRGVRPTLVWSGAMWEPRPGLSHGFGRIGLVVKAPRPDDHYGIFYSKAEVPQEFLAVLAVLAACATRRRSSTPLSCSAS